MVLPITDFFEQASNFDNITGPDVGDPTPLAGEQDALPFPTPASEIPGPSDVPGVNLPSVQSPGFGPIVPDTTKGATAADSPGQLFTEENMGADNAAGFLQDYVDKAGGVQAEETMFGQLQGVLNEENPLFDWARGQAAQYANSRGLMNSDIGAQAASEAVMGAALPIAQFDATVYAEAAAQERNFWFTAGLQAFDATIQSGLMAQDHLQRMVQMSHQGDINSRLQLEQFGYNWNLNEQTNLHNMKLATLQGNIASGLALQKFGFDTELMKQDFGYRVKLQDIELRNALKLSSQDHNQWLQRISAQNAATLQQIGAAGAQDRANILAQGEEQRRNIAAGGEQDRLNIIAGGEQDRLNIEQQGELDTQRDTDTFSRNLQQNYLNATERRSLQFSQEIQNIYSQQGLTAAQQNNAVNVARRNYENDLAMLARQYSSSPGWDDSWIISPMQTPNDPSPPGSEPPPPPPGGPPPPPPTIPPPPPRRPPIDPRDERQPPGGRPRNIQNEDARLISGGAGPGFQPPERFQAPTFVPPPATIQPTAGPATAQSRNIRSGGGSARGLR